MTDFLTETHVRGFALDTFARLPPTTAPLIHDACAYHACHHVAETGTLAA